MSEALSEDSRTNSAVGDQEQSAELADLCLAMVYTLWARTGHRLEVRQSSLHLSSFPSLSVGPSVGHS